MSELKDLILNTRLTRLRLSSGEAGPFWTVRHACEGTQIFGATGSGKTTGSGRTLALSLLRTEIHTHTIQFPIRFGGLVLTAKPDELGLWVANEPEHGAPLGYCQLTDREDDVVVLGTDLERYQDWGLTLPTDSSGHVRPYRFNFLDYERQASPDEDLVGNLVAVFLTALGSDRISGPNVDPYWEDALRQLLTNSIDLVLLAKRPVTLQDMTQIILTAPETREQARSAHWQNNSLCWHLLDEASKRQDLKPARRDDLRQTAEYWLLDYAGLSERTRSVIVSSFTSKATALLRSPLRELLAAGDTDPELTPESAMRGKVIILDLSVKQYGEVGRFAQVLYKTIWQRAVERRRFGPNEPSPVFLWADESQYFVTPEDMLFQQTARGAVAATVYLTQNLPNYYAAIETRDPHATTDSLLGNFHTKVFHVNGDPVTNEWGERLFGRFLRGRTTVQTSFSPDRDRKAQAADETRQSVGTSIHPAWESRVPAIEFTQLKKGGPPDLVTETIIWFDGHPLRAVFSQQGLPEPP